MKIETVAWKWADKVQSKNIYRDEQFIRTKSKEEALKAIDFLMNKPHGLTYTITVFRDEEYFTYYRHTMPCLGGLVKYRDSHGDRYSMNPMFPRDIYVAFPEGEIVYIACQRDRRVKLDSPLIQFMFSQESPWVSAFGSKETIIFNDSYFILTNMNTDPTVFYSLMRLGGFAGYITSEYKNWDPRAQLLAMKNTQADPRRLAGQKPIRISGGTWAEGFGYTRPYNESIFKTAIKTPFENFKKLGGYPQTTYTNKYFVGEMKNIFGVDCGSYGIPVKAEYEKPLIEAWDYFKAASMSLSDEPGNQASDANIKYIRATINKSSQDFAMNIMRVNQVEAE